MAQNLEGHPLGRYGKNPFEDESFAILEWDGFQLSDLRKNDATKNFLAVIGDRIDSGKWLVLPSATEDDHALKMRKMLRQESRNMGFK